MDGSEDKKSLTLFRPFRRIWNEAVGTYKTISSVRWLLLGVIAGCLSGVAAVLFFLGVEGLRFLFLHKLAGLHLPAPAGERLFFSGSEGPSRFWVIPLLTTSVGLLTGFLVSRFISPRPTGGTDGTDTMIKAFHQQAGLIRLRSALIKACTSVLTIASGGSAGREGPISLLGAGLGSFLATRLGLSSKERRILLLAGAAGGLGAIFRAPLGGALTAVEVIYREDFEAEAILPSVISSVVAYTIFTLVYGTDPLFGIPHFSFHDARELPFYMVLALVCAISGWFYVKCFFFIKFKIFHRILDRIGIVWTTGLGGLAMGLLGMAFPMLLSGGYGWLEMAILGKLSIAAMLGILIGKTIATSITLGSGMSGGMFAPALFVGGMSGGAVGYFFHSLYPQIVTQPGGYVLVGMATFFTGVANAPIGPLIMVCELTQGYGLLAPLMLASALCLVINRNISLYENQVDSKFDSPAHIDDATINILEGLKVGDFFRPGRVTTMEEGTSFAAMTDILTNSHEFSFPVRGQDDSITGVVTVQDLRKLLFEDSLSDILVAKDVAKKSVLLTSEDDLYMALLKFVDTDYGQIPVVSEKDPKQILGMLSREDVFKAYADTLKKLKEE
ncbi:MAG: chloride channel protein [Desulfovibrionales bacterium]